MKEFISKVVSNNSKYHQDSLTYKDLKKVQACVLKSMNVDNMIALRDKYEGNAFYERFLKKIISMIILEYLLKLKIIDWENLDPKNYVPTVEINGKIIDVLTADFGEFPVIDNISNAPAIIAIKKGDKKVWICGYASVEVLNKNQDERLIKLGSTKGFDGKTAFIGFENLIQFNSLEGLKKIV